MKTKTILETKNRTQTLCSFCSTPLKKEDYENPNDFYLACYQHKQLAQIETEKFFKENPHYEKWQTPKKMIIKTHPDTLIVNTQENDSIISEIPQQEIDETFEEFQKRYMKWYSELPQAKARGFTQGRS